MRCGERPKRISFAVLLAVVWDGEGREIDIEDSLATNPQPNRLVLLGSVLLGFLVRFSAY